MTDYRLYFLCTNGIHIERFEPIQARNDGQAIAIATLYAGIGPIELYQRGRKVHAVAGGATTMRDWRLQ